MKNFPHQYNDLRKFRASLETVRDLNLRGADADDDGVLGYELALRQIYGFRHLDSSTDGAEVRARISQRIIAEQAKPTGRQGARTAAREVRRTLGYLGWLVDSGSALTPAGETLLDAIEGSDGEVALMQQAITSIALTDSAERVSHPVRILLRLIDEVELWSRSGMELALEAEDDSVEEFRRIVALALLSDEERVLQLKGNGWTTSQLANSTKILPALAHEAGLMTKDASGRFILTDSGRRMLGRAPVRMAPRVRGVVTPRRYHRATAISTRNAGEVAAGRRLIAAERRVLSAEEQATAAELLYERTGLHQDLVRSFAEACVEAEFHEDAAAYDLLVDRGAGVPLVLVEAKTIAGDAIQQIRTSVGQLLYYEHFSLAESFPDRDILRLTVVDNVVSDGLAEFLEVNKVGLLVRAGDAFVPRNPYGSRLAREILRRASLR
jgi:hypothetical protein